MRAHGDFIALSDQDDIWFKNKIELLVFIYGGKFDISFSDILIGEDITHTIRTRYRYNIEYLLFFPLMGHSMLLRKGFAQTPQYWTWTTNRFYDWGLAQSAQIEGNSIVKVEEPLCFHRRHKGEVTQQGIIDIKPSKWKPYILGWKEYRRIQTSEKWKFLYSDLLSRMNGDKFHLARKLVKCLLSRKLTRLFHLCWLCMIHKDKIYPKETRGIIGYMRGFFFPSINYYPQKFRKVWGQ